MTVQEVKQQIERRLNQIKPFFVPTMELTFIARKPDNDHADFVVTNDSLAELAKVVERMQVQSGQPSEVVELRAEVERLKGELSGVRCKACPECGSKKISDEDSLAKNYRVCADCGQEWYVDIDYERAGVHHKKGLEEGRKESADLERSYSQQLGEMARLCDVVCEAVLGFKEVDLFEPGVIGSAQAIMEYVDAVRPPEGSPNSEWIVHILGPDDVIPCVSQYEALRTANEINREWAKWCAENPSPNNPVQIAVAKTEGGCGEGEKK